MSRLRPHPTGAERVFADDEIIVSKTDLSGRITYVNDVFVRVSGYQRAELLGAPHSLIRHPQMPRAIFHLLWDTVQAGREVFAYVLNLCRTGEHYWVYAHVTPTFDTAGRIVGYHSNRRTAERRELAEVEALYERLRRAEAGADQRRDAVAAGVAALRDFLQDRGLSYDEYVWSL